MVALHLFDVEGVLEECRLLHFPVIEQRARHDAVIGLVVVRRMTLVAQLPAGEPTGIRFHTHTMIVGLHSILR